MWGEIDLFIQISLLIGIEEKKIECTEMLTMEDYIKIKKFLTQAASILGRHILIGWKEFYAVSAIFQPCKGGAV